MQQTLSSTTQLVLESKYHKDREQQLSVSLFEERKKIAIKDTDYTALLEVLLLEGLLPRLEIIFPLSTPTGLFGFPLPQN